MQHENKKKENKIKRIKKSHEKNLKKKKPNVFSFQSSLFQLMMMTMTKPSPICASLNSFHAHCTQRVWMWTLFTLYMYRYPMRYAFCKYVRKGSAAASVIGERYSECSTLRGSR